MTKTAAPITFIVSQSQTLDAVTARGAAAAALPAGLARGQRKQLVRIGVQRGVGAETRVEAVPGEDVVVLHIAGGPALVLHPETARDLLLAQGSAKQTRGVTAASVTADGVEVPANLRWAGLDRPATRGWLGNVVLSAVEVLTGLAKDPAADLVAAGVVKRVDAQVEPGVYQLDAETLPPLKGRAPLAKVPAADTPALVLLHGTFSNTSGTFAKLWTQHPGRVRELFAHYAGRVYGLDHPTLGVSPIENALTLAGALPRDAAVHLLSHSRGGLVAEVLARVCANPDLRPGDLEPFAGADYRRQRDALQQLAATVRQRRIRVERLVRVACPARGTLLASKRLDAYLSVFKWTLELAGAPVLPELVDFLGEVAQRRTDPTLIPGLAAQMPNSPLVQWLHAVEEPLPGSLRVIAGDIEGDSVTSWLKTLLADAFYWTDHDLVVQTRSMYGGAPRQAGATFVFDQGGTVSHFNYFSNERTADAIADALVQDAPAGFRTIGPLSWAGQSATGTRGVDRGAVRGGDDGTPPERKPAVFILPGILGSNLKIGKDRIWLGWRLVNGLQRLAYQPGAPDGVEPDGPIGMYYDDLGRFLAHSHEVIEFAFDWRKPMEDEARRLAEAVDKALAARQASGTPVRLLAHSMGGVLARTMQLERPGTWDAMMARDGARLLMLGTPNAGSWAPMQVLSGDDTFGNLMVTVGAPFQDKAARDLMARLPGFLQLQASLRDEKLDLARNATWATLAADDLERLRERGWWHNLKEQLGVYSWGVPPQSVLDRAVALRQRLDDQRDRPPTGFPDKLALVIGRADFTPDGYEIGEDGLVYLNAPDHGDGRVTLASALLPGVATWAVNCVHGSLPDFQDAFAGYLDLLATGKTDKLTLWSEGRGLREADARGMAYVRSRPAHDRASAMPPEDERAVVARQDRPTRPEGAPRDRALRITVRNGDLSFVHQPLLLGHYQSLRLTGTEYVMDRLVGGQMKQALAVGHYPAATGEHAIFLNTRAAADDPRQLPRPQAVVVVGLGEEGKLRATDLVQAVRQATIGWVLRAAERGDAPVELELAATLIGSGGSGIAVGQSAQLVAQGVREANERLHDANQRWRGGRPRPGDADTGRAAAWPLIGHLYLIELYLDRATEAWRALRVQARATPRDYALSDTVLQGTGALPRPLDSGYRGADYDFISAIAEPDPQGDARIAYTLDTKRARSEVRAQKTQGRLLRELVASGSSDQNSDPQIGSTLFKLLIPAEMEPFFGGSTEMQLELNDGTAGIPWELLDTDATGGDPRPWAIRAKLLRKLRTAAFRVPVHDAGADGGILVIGEPEASPEAGRNVTYPRLPGARDEARAVVAQFAQQRRNGGSNPLGDVRGLISSDDPARVGPDARTVMNALMERDRVWRIIHIAGHGEPPDQVGADPADPNDRGQGPGNPRGVVLSGGTYLGPREIAALRVVPELVFVNCCYLGARHTASVLDVETPGYLDDRATFAAGVAEQLIRIGVRCVIAAGWAVGDAPAKEFAQTFYGALLADPPTRFIDAVAQAREAARALGGNTWAAYQCYGDPDWILRRGDSDPQAPPRPLQEEFGAVASSDGLELALRTLEIRSQYQHAPADEQRGKIRYLESRFVSMWGGRGSVAEAFGAAWNAAQDPEAAIAWYRRALAANDGTASLRAAEQLGNLQVLRAWAAVQEFPATVASPAASSTPKRARGRVGRDAAARARADALTAASGAIAQGLAQLQRVAAIEPSVERHSLCGSAWKRQAMVAALVGDPRAERAALAQMRDCYAQAERIAHENCDAELFYPGLNRIAAEVAGAAGGAVVLDAARVERVLENLAAKNRDAPTFWSVAGLTDLSTYEALARGGLAAALDAIEREYDDLHQRCEAKSLWDSVADQADFVLSRYAAGASDRERRAADRLRAFLATKAGRPLRAVAISAPTMEPPARPLRARARGKASRTRRAPR